MLFWRKLTFFLNLHTFCVKQFWIKLCLCKKNCLFHDVKQFGFCLSSCRVYTVTLGTGRRNSKPFFNTSTHFSGEPIWYFMHGYIQFVSLCGIYEIYSSPHPDMKNVLCAASIHLYFFYTLGKLFALNICFWQETCFLS